MSNMLRSRIRWFVCDTHGKGYLLQTDSNGLYLEAFQRFSFLGDVNFVDAILQTAAPLREKKRGRETVSYCKLEFMYNTLMKNESSVCRDGKASASSAGFSGSLVFHLWSSKGELTFVFRMWKRSRLEKLLVQMASVLDS